MSRSVGALILIVEDEADLVSALEYNLGRDGFQTRTALSAMGALKGALLDPIPDLILLDLMLPDLSGTEVCRQLRMNERTRNVPVLMLTAKGEEIDRVVGFEVGADDYVVKPFSVRELILRVHAILRRRHSDAPDEGKIRFGPLRIDPLGYRAFIDDGEITLTAIEFKLLSTLMSRNGRVQTREMLLSDVWDIEAEITTRTVDTHVKRLREKLKSAGSFIETIRGVGYRFRAFPDESEA